MNGITLRLSYRLTRSLMWLTIVASVTQVAVAEDITASTDNGSTSPLASESPSFNHLEELRPSLRIIGGRDAEANSWPSLVALVSPGAQSVKSRFFCGATVVAPGWVMTAAHCVFDTFGQRIQPVSVRVIAGIRNLDNDVPSEEVVVTSILVHPEYDNNLELPPFDIALLELGSVINAPVVDLFAGDPADYSGVTSYIAGWGATRFVNENNATYPSQLQNAAVPIVPLLRCNSIVSYQGLITHRQVCAGFVEGGVDACAGDSGGPLFIIEEGVIRQMGITSYGNGCALANFYGVYTSVTHLLPWLSNYLDVPFQSPELAARLDSGESAVEPAPGPTPLADDDSEGYFFGAIDVLSGFALLILLLCRRRTH